jgi:large subunit ribosomal protein LP0
VFENNTLYDPAVLDITDEDMMSAVTAGIANVAALSLSTDYPTLASIPHSVINGYKNVLGLSLATDYTFPKAQKVCVCTCAGSQPASCLPFCLR